MDAVDDDGTRVPPRHREPQEQPWPRRAEREQRPFPPPRHADPDTRRPLPPRRVESVDVPTRPVPPRRGAPPPPVGRPAVEPPPVRRPVQERPMHDHPVRDRPLHERPVPERPVHERPVHERPAHERPARDRPLHDPMALGAPRNVPPLLEPPTRPVPPTRPADGPRDRTGSRPRPDGLPPRVPGDQRGPGDNGRVRPRDTGERALPSRVPPRDVSPRERDTGERAVPARSPFPPRERDTGERAGLRRPVPPDAAETERTPVVRDTDGPDGPEEQRSESTADGRVRRPHGPAAAAAARRRRAAAAKRPPRTLGNALLATAAATVAPGSGHLMLRRRRTGALILGVFVLAIVAVALLVLTSSRSDLLQNALSSRVLIVVVIAIVVAALAWISVIVRTYMLARPRGLDTGRQALGIVGVVALCLVVAAPMGFAANLANSQRNLLDTLFAGDKGGTAVADAITKPRLNILLVGSDAGPDREGTRTDSMMVASLDTKTGRTTIFGLPRNIESAPFPAGSPMAKKFPKGFHDANDPNSGEYLLNAIYAYAHSHPELAPATPTSDPGLNMLHQTIGYMLGLQLDYYVEVNMAGFASIIDALGGLTVDVGAKPIPIGGILPDGTHVRPDRYIPAGVQRLSGEDALAYARSRTDSTDYTRMGRQRCLLQNILKQKSPADLLTNFQGVAAATTNSVSTNIPQQVLPALVSLAGAESVMLESISFDPSLPDPDQDDGHFSTGDPNYKLMKQVVQDAIAPKAATPPPAAATPAAPTSAAKPGTGAKPSAGAQASGANAAPTTDAAAPQSLAAECG